MSYVVLLIVVSLVISPIFWIMPSPKQKRQEKLRARAMAVGLQVKICNLPQAHRTQVRRERIEQGVLYRRLWETKVNVPPSPHLCLLTRQGFEWTGTVSNTIRESFEQALASQHSGVVALEYSSAGVGAYWSEKGSEETVEAIFNMLDQLRDKLLPELKE